MSEKSDLPRQAGGVLNRGCQACGALRGLVSMVGVSCQLRQGLVCCSINWRQVGVIPMLCSLAAVSNFIATASAT
jgi:hypothetical protein